MKVVYDCENNFVPKVNANYLNPYNNKRSELNLPPVECASFINRHDPILVEVIESSAHKLENTGLKIGAVYSGEYSIIVENGSERVIDDPVSVVDKLFQNLRQTYYSGQNDAKKQLSCQMIMQRIFAIVNTY